MVPLAVPPAPAAPRPAPRPNTSSSGDGKIQRDPEACSVIAHPEKEARTEAEASFGRMREGEGAVRQGADK